MKILQFIRLRSVILVIQLYNSSCALKIIISLGGYTGALLYISNRVIFYGRMKESEDK